MAKPFVNSKAQIQGINIYIYIFFFKATHTDLTAPANSSSIVNIYVHPYTQDPASLIECIERQTHLSSSL